jgi:hypothetical protein
LGGGTATVEVAQYVQESVRALHSPGEGPRESVAALAAARHSSGAGEWDVVGRACGGPAAVAVVAAGGGSARPGVVALRRSASGRGPGARWGLAASRWGMGGSAILVSLVAGSWGRSIMGTWGGWAG